MEPETRVLPRTLNTERPLLSAVALLDARHKVETLDEPCANCYGCNKTPSEGGELMSQKIVAGTVNAQGELRLPKSVRTALHLRRTDRLVGFVIEGGRVLLTKATIIPEPTLSDEELASLAHLSKRGAGRRTFRTQDDALRYLWSL